MDDEEKLCRIALNTAPYLHPVIYHRLLAAFGSAHNVFAAAGDRLAGVKGVPEALAERIKKIDPVERGRGELALAEKLGVSIVTLGEEGYPGPLVNIFAPPPVLSIAGRWRERDELSLAVVGTRSPTTYGKMLAEQFSERLVQAGFVVVSGLAYGVDGVAHRAALKSGGRTVAVLGNGLNVYYPPAHRELQKKISASGAVISQFPLAAAPDRRQFPMRNRVIAGLTLGVLVIEAPAKSGALITAYEALDSNRDVFALPGPVNSKKSEGTNRLIKKGHAKLVQTVEDIIDELPGYLRETIETRQAALPLDMAEPMTDEEAHVAKILDNDEKHIDRIAADAGLPLQKVSAILLSLEIKGLVKQLAGKMFVRGFRE